MPALPASQILIQAAMHRMWSFGWTWLLSWRVFSCRSRRNEWHQARHLSRMFSVCYIFQVGRHLPASSSCTRRGGKAALISCCCLTVVTRWANAEKHRRCQMRSMLRRSAVWGSVAADATTSTFAGVAMTAPIMKYGASSRAVSIAQVNFQEMRKRYSETLFKKCIFDIWNEQLRGSRCRDLYGVPLEWSEDGEWFLKHLRPPSWALRAGRSHPRSYPSCCKASVSMARKASLNAARLSCFSPASSPLSWTRLRDSVHRHNNLSAVRSKTSFH